MRRSDTVGRRAVDELGVEALRRHGQLRIKARGGSMLPFVRDGDVIVISKTERGAIGVGDIVCYETAPGRLVVHRVIGYDRDRLRIKGDALGYTELVEPSQLLGKVLSVERHGRLTRFDTTRARWRNRVIAALAPAVRWLLPVVLASRRTWRAIVHG